jgi:lipopolysaccharide export system protein LptC
VSVELHLPDLPEVPLSLGPAPVPLPMSAQQHRRAMPWHLRLQGTLSAYLPLLLMALLALGTWWLVKNAPRPVLAPEERVVSNEPDYTMTQFVVSRFDPQGRVTLRIEGAQLRHFPDTDRVEIDDATIRAFAPDGRVTLARAKRAVGSGDGSELQLQGRAEVTSQDAAGVPLLMRSEFLHAYLLLERVKSNQPVRVQHGGADLQAAGLNYDHATSRLDLTGPVRAVLPARASKPNAKVADTAALLSQAQVQAQDQTQAQPKARP